MSTRSAPLEKIVLASGSPRRADLLRAAGIEFDMVVADIDEARGVDERPDAYVTRLAAAKAYAVRPAAPDRVIVGADTAVVVDRQILGKPLDEDDARRMLRALSGREHLVLTGVAVLHPGGAPITDVATTTVRFATLSSAELEWYVSSGEPMDKAGAYAIQGLGSRFVTRIEGSYSNVVGLPVAVVYRLIHRLT